jgi:predicted SAM-dependent methyltransferase
VSDAAKHREALRLHLGCGERTPRGWLNVDHFIGARVGRIPGLPWICRALGVFRLSWSPEIFVHDLRRAFPWDDDSADAIYSSHTLEHLSPGEGLRFMRECHRVLRPGGVIRIVVPDLRACVERYLAGKLSSLEFLDALSVDPVQPGDGRFKRLLAPHVRFPHRCMYDAETLLSRMRAAGFEAELTDTFRSRIQDVGAVETPDRTDDAVIAEGTK